MFYADVVQRKTPKSLVNYVSFTVGSLLPLGNPSAAWKLSGHTLHTRARRRTFAVNRGNWEIPELVMGAAKLGILITRGKEMR